MPVVTEVRGEAQVDLVAEYVDIFQIGARIMYDQDAQKSINWLRLGEIKFKVI